MPAQAQTQRGCYCIAGGPCTSIPNHDDREEEVSARISRTLPSAALDSAISEFSNQSVKQLGCLDRAVKSNKVQTAGHATSIGKVDSQYDVGFKVPFKCDMLLLFEPAARAGTQG